MCDWNFVRNNEEENHQRFKSEGITWFPAMESRQAAPPHLQFGTLQWSWGWRWLLEHEEQLDKKERESVRRGFWEKETAYAKAEASEWWLKNHNCWMYPDPKSVWYLAMGGPEKKQSKKKKKQGEVVWDLDFTLIIK